MALDQLLLAMGAIFFFVLGHCSFGQYAIV
jgi:hypothetical protein